MNTVPIIRKGSIKDYCSNGFGGGMVIGIMVFLAALINNSIITSLLHGLFAWIAIFILFIGIGFTSEEYYKRKKRLQTELMRSLVELSSPSGLQARPGCH